MAKTGFIKIRTIVPKGFFNPKNAKQEERMWRVIDNALDEVAENFRVDLAVTTQTWRSRPVFLVTKYKNIRIISTTDLIYKFVSGGTRVRYAHMSKDFIAKTQVRWIGSRAGRGGLAWISKRHPLPGIKAREFPKEVIEKWKTRVPGIFQREIARELDRG